MKRISASLAVFLMLFSTTSQSVFASGVESHSDSITAAQAVQTSTTSTDPGIYPAPPDETTDQALADYQNAVNDNTANPWSDTSALDLNKIFDNAPFTIPDVQASISKMTGSFMISNSDFKVVDRNGLSFSLTRSYDSESAQLYDVDYSSAALGETAKYDRMMSLLGPGWTWNIPSFDTKHNVIHLPSGSAYGVTWSGSQCYLHGDAYKDFQFSISAAPETKEPYGNTGYELQSVKDHLNYYFNGGGQLMVIEDSFKNEINFAYQDFSAPINYEDFTAANANDYTTNPSYPIKSITSNTGNSITFNYLPEQNGTPQELIVTSSTGDQPNDTYSVTYKFTKKSFDVSQNTAYVADSKSISVPVLSEVDQQVNRMVSTGTTSTTTQPETLVTTYNVVPSLAKSIFEKTYYTNNPYALINVVQYPSGATAHIGYSSARTVANTTINNTSNQDFPVSDFNVTRMVDSTDYEQAPNEFYDHYQLTYDGNVGTPAKDLGKNEFAVTINTSDSKTKNRSITYTYYKDDTTGIPFFPMQTQVDQTGTTKKTTSYTYDTSKKYPDPLSTTEVISYTDPSKTQTQTITSSDSYDAYGHVITETDPANIVKSYSYDSNNWLSQEIDFLQGTATTDVGAQYKKTSYTRDSNGFVTDTTVTDQNGTVLQKEDDIQDANGYGNIGEKDTSDLNNKVYKTTYTYDTALAFPATESTQVTDVNSNTKTVTSSYKFDDMTGNPLQIIDGNGNQTNYQYDSLNRPIMVSYSDNTGVALTYDDSIASNNFGTTLEMDTLKNWTDPTSAQKKVINKWDGLGLKRESGYFDVTNGNNYHKQTSWSYDDYGRVKDTIDGNGNDVTSQYDDSDRLTLTTNPDGTTNQIAYDDVNNTKTTTDTDVSGSKNTTIETDDANGRVLSNQVVVAGTNKLVSSYSYDELGNVLTSTGGITDANGKSLDVTNNTYDAMSNLTSVSTPDGNTTKYTYDLRGNVVQVQYPGGKMMTKQYDELGDLIKQTDENGNITQYFYDANKNMIKEIDHNNNVITFGYDDQNRLLNKTGVDSKNNADSISYTYDAMGQRLTMQEDTGTSTYTYTYSYTPTEKVQSVKAPDGNTISYTYDLNNNRTSMTDPAGRQIFYGIDDRNRIGSISLGSVSASKEISYGYEFNQSLLSQITLGNNDTVTRQFDDALNLKSIDQKTQSGNTINSYSYTYDPNGNQLSKSDNNTTNTFTYDLMNRIQTSTQNNETYAYDARGNRQTVQSDSSAFLPSTNKYLYDVWNRLTQVTTADGKVVTYKYNGDGQLYERTENGTTTRYYWDGDQLIADATVNSGVATLNATYIRGHNNQLVERLDANGNKYYYLLNGHGDVVGLTDGSGNVVNQYTYDIWGNPASTNETVSNPFRYSGELWDNTTGLQYLNARWYDPSQGRFLNQDTDPGKIKDPLSLNLYSYVENNPLSYVDRSGHAFVPVDEDAEADGPEGGFDIWGFLNSVASWWATVTGATYTLGDSSDFDAIMGLTDKNVVASDSFYEGGQLAWPTPTGAVEGSEESITLETGSLIDRFGSKFGNFASPAGTPYAQRALPYVPNANAYHLYRVLKDIPNVMQGIIAGAFNQEGGGIQYKFNETLDWLVQNEYIEEVYPNNGY